MVVVYGIPNCDTVKKATAWLKAHDVDFQFHDYKTQGAPADKLKNWSAIKGWEFIFNKRSTTWKDLVAAGATDVKTTRAALSLMAKHTSIIKRPVIEAGDQLLVGFNENEYIQQFIKNKKTTS